MIKVAVGAFKGGRCTGSGGVLIAAIGALGGILAHFRAVAPLAAIEAHPRSIYEKGDGFDFVP